MSRPPSDQDPDTKKVHNPAHERDFCLSRHDAAAGGPADQSVTGEEDPGAGLEFLVNKE